MSMKTVSATMKEQLPFQVDMEGYLRQYETVFRRPIVDGYHALPFGNGDLAAVMWQPEHLTWMLNKCDIGGTSQVARLRIETPTPLADRIGTLESRLSLAEATVTVNYEGGRIPSDAYGIWKGKYGRQPKAGDMDLGSVNASAYIPEGRNVLLVDYRSESPAAFPTTIVMERWIQEENIPDDQPQNRVWGDRLSARIQGQMLVLHYQLDDGSSFAAVLAYEGFRGATLAQPSPYRVTLTVPASGEIFGRIAVAVVTSGESDDPLAEAARLAAASLGGAEGELRARNRAFWKEFWDQGFVDAGHPYLNALYHMALYELGISSRGRRPVQFNGGLNLWREAYRTWGDGFWCHNQSEVYLGTYAANHVELVENFHRWIASIRPEAVKAAAKYFQLPGAYYPEIMSLNYRVDEAEPGFHSDIRYILSSGVRYSLMLWNRYHYTLDETFLAEQAYPVIRDCAEFYAHYGKLGEDGLYHVEPSLSWEDRPLGKDSHADCAAWRAIFPIAIEAARHLRVDRKLIPVWKERLDKAPPYPVYERLFSIVTRPDGLPEPPKWEWQAPHLSSVFPYSVIGIDSAASLRTRAEATFQRFRFQSDAGHEFYPVIAARLGQAEWWRAALFQYIQYFQSADQGLFHYYNLNGAKTKERNDIDQFHAYLEGSGNLLTATNEMLLQSYNGRIRVFPAIPRHWHGRFILKAAGAFMVASEHREAEGVAYVAIEPVGGSARRCRVVVPWPHGGELFADGKRVKAAKRIVAFLAQPGTVYLLLPKGRTMDSVPKERLDFKKTLSPMRLGNVWYGNPDTYPVHTVTMPLW
ncbi:MAG: hypothetical protein PHR35_09075 [Kiritimatiellae bacterium]|nr:hypothetical protein [Kiritimatiellia bacterium]